MPLYNGREEASSSAKPDQGRIFWYLGGVTAVATVALLPFLAIPWLPKRKFGALPYMNTPRSKLELLFNQMLPRHVAGSAAAPSTPGAPRLRHQQQQQMPPQGKPKRFIDLGSGMGEAVIEARKRGYEARGVELNPTLLLLSSMAAMRRLGPLAFVQQPRVSFKMHNMFSVPLHQYDVIMVFGVQSLMSRLTDKIRAEAQDGAVVVLYRFQLDVPPREAEAVGAKAASALEAQGAQIELVENAEELSIYKVYRAKASKEMKYKK